MIEVDGAVLPIDVKTTTRPRVADARYLVTVRRQYRARVRAGLLLHAGATLDRLLPDVLAAPWWTVV